MKTIVENVTNLSKFLFEDDKRVVMLADRIDVGPEEKLDFIVGCHSSSDCTLYENVTEPDDWYGNKYTFKDGVFTLVEDWIDPRIADEEARAALQAEIEAAKKAAEESSE